MFLPEPRKRPRQLVAQRTRWLSRPDLCDSVAEDLLDRRTRGATPRKQGERESPYGKRRADATILSPVSTNPNHELGQREYAEVVGALVAVRRFAGEMSDVYTDFGRPNQEEDAGARAMVDACDRALDALRYDGAR
jgi:hypothetical protein